MANNQVPTATNSFAVSGHYADFHGGLHIRLPIKGSRWVPYFVVAGGGFRSFGTKLTVKVNATGATTTTAIAGETVGAFNVGGGVRYYVNERVGLRAEVKAYGPSGNFGGTIVRASFGAFIQFNTHK